MLSDAPVIGLATVESLGTKLIPCAGEANGHLCECVYGEFSDIILVRRLGALQSFRGRGDLIGVADDVTAQVVEQRLRSGGACDDFVCEPLWERRTSWCVLSGRLTWTA